MPYLRDKGKTSVYAIASDKQAKLNIPLLAPSAY